jgi:hypothetical protein
MVPVCKAAAAVDVAVVTLAGEVDVVALHKAPELGVFAKCHVTEGFSIVHRVALIKLSINYSRE